MANMTSAEMAEKWGRKLKQSGEDIRRGVARVSEAPSTQAIKKKDKMQVRLNEAINDGRWEKGLEAYPLESWKKDMTETGIGRISSGVDKAATKMKNFADYSIATTDAGKSKVAAMPDTSLDDNIARANAMMRHMANNPYKKGKR